MKAYVKIRNRDTVLREKNADASTLINILPITENKLTATEYSKGWYYISEYFGWVKASDLTIISVEEAIDDDDTSHESIGTHPIEKNAYIAEDIVSAINKGSYQIRANKIYLIIDDTEINLETVIKSLNNSLKDMNNVVTKMNKMENVPLIDGTCILGMVPVLIQDPLDENKLVVGWGNVDYGDIANTPSGTTTETEW